MQRERPILFSTPMVRRLPGIEKNPARWKTQTRRIIKPQPGNPEVRGPISPIWGHGVPRPETDPQQRFNIHAAFPVNGKRVDRWLPCPYGAPGDQLWVRETWAPHADEEETFRGYHTLHGGGDYGVSCVGAGNIRPEIFYAADGGDPHVNGWRPSIHLPKWAARIWLEVTGIRVERLQDITEEDAKAEGCDERRTEHWSAWDPVTEGYPEFFTRPTDPRLENIRRHADSVTTARKAFEILWGQINGRASWEANPWVWVVSFKGAERKVVAA